MAVPFSNTKLRVPRGFQNLLEGFAREVLRSQPTELYAFGAQYFENLLKIREEGGVDPAEHGAKMEDRFYNNKAFTEPTVDPSDPQQQGAATAIQTKYRQHAAKQEVENIREEKAATKIQAGFRGHQDRQRVKDIREGKEQATPSAPTDVSAAAPTEEEVDIDLNDPDVEKAAVKIQAGFKGFKARQEVSRLKEKPDELETNQPDSTECPADTSTEIDIDLNDPEVEKAAVKIQAGYKGFKTRKDMEVKQADDKVYEQTEVQVREVAELHQSERVIMTNETAPVKVVQCSAPEHEILELQEETVDIDLNDPEVEAAAVKIQAGFKGYKTRKEMQPKQSRTASPSQSDELVDIDLNDPEVAKAAVMIQAGFKKGLMRKKAGSTTKEDMDKK